MSRLLGRDALTAIDRTPELVVADAGGWRSWLRDHHGSSDGVRLVLARKGVPGPTTLTHAEALEEALAHGWIDGQAGPRDLATFTVRFTPRRRRSRWSKRNTELAERLIAQRRMTAAGLAEVERAKSDGRWEAAYPGTAGIAVPADLTAALKAKPRANRNFGLLTAQNRFAILYRVLDAKRPDTRARRIAQFVDMLDRGDTFYPQRQALSR